MINYVYRKLDIPCVRLKFFEVAGVVTPSLPLKNFCLYPPPILRCLWKDSSVTPTTPLQSSFSVTPPPPPTHTHTHMIFHNSIYDNCTVGVVVRVPFQKEPARMANNFDFKMPVIYIMFKLTILIASTTTTANFE